MKTKFILILLLLTSFCLNAQNLERERPKEWNALVMGGRFMDRFNPMVDIGIKTNHCWGVDAVKPRDVLNGIEDPAWSYWGGNILKDEEGLFHLYVSRWPERSLLGHNEWSNSDIVHATSESSMGPFEVVERIGKGHNPEAFILPSGKVVVYGINQCYVSNSFYGPWKRGKFKFDPYGRKIIEGLSNVSFSQREDGSRLIVCRGGGIWISKDGFNYKQISNRSVYPAVKGAYEDPVIWRTDVQFHMIVNDWLGRIAYHLRSKNGLDWVVDPGEAYLPGIAGYEDGVSNGWYKYERIKVFQDQWGRATQANFAVIDYMKKEDKGSDNHNSKNIVIPLEVGRKLTLVNQQRFKQGEVIELILHSEADFNAATDVDINSIHYGSPQFVDFGKGLSVLDSKVVDGDLHLFFRAGLDGLTSSNFTAKLIGKKRDGSLLFGYHQLPWVDYKTTLLSSRMIRKCIRNGKQVLIASIENFGPFDYLSGKIRVVITKNNHRQEWIAPIGELKSWTKEVFYLDLPKTLELKGICEVELFSMEQETALIQAKLLM